MSFVLILKYLTLNFFVMYITQIALFFEWVFAVFKCGIEGQLKHSIKFLSNDFRFLPMFVFSFIFIINVKRARSDVSSYYIS